jgi:peptidoglycan-associated lipoprotein
VAPIARRSHPALVAMVLSLATASCAHVTPKDLDARLATLRSDMAQQIQDGDQRVASDLGQRIDGVESRVSNLESALKDLKDQYGVKIEQLENAVRFDVPVYFDYDKADLKTPGTQVLDRFSQVASQYYAGARITVEGFTDPSGSEAYNKRLGQRRADAVKDYLVDKGVSSDQLRAVSYGESAARQVEKGAAGPGTTGWENRRVVMVIDHMASSQSTPISDSGSR